MKKRFLLLLPILLLTGCEEVETTAPDPLADALSKLQTDICLTGTSTKKREFQSPAYSQNNTEFNSTDKVTILSDKYELVSERNDGETVNRKAFKDQDGFAAEQYLTYQNEVALKPVVDGSGDKVVYSNEYGNPFLDLTVEDLEKETDTTYKIAEEKSLVFCHKLLGEDVQGEIKLTYEDGAFTKLTAENLTNDTFFVSTQNYTKLKVTVGFDYSFDEVTTIADSVTSATNDNPELETALSGLKDGFRFNNLQDGAVTMSSFFDGTSALYQMFSPGATSPSMLDMYFTANDQETMDLYIYMDEGTGFILNDPEVLEMYYEKVSYDYLTSDIQNLSAAVFKKTGTNTYVPEENALNRIGEHIIPGIYDALNLTSYEEFRYATTELTVTLVDENTINFDYTAVLTTTATSTRITASFQFAEIGECELPYQPSIA